VSRKLAVIMPICNGAATLSRTFDTLADAGAQSLEIIAVVQHSEDGSRGIVSRAAEHLPIQIIDTEADSNWVRNTNIGLRAATADIATMLHQDDIWLPRRRVVVDRLVDAFRNADIWVHSAKYIDNSDRQIGLIGPPFGRCQRLVPDGEAMRALIVQNTIPLPGAVFRRSAALEEGGLREDLWYTADWDLWLRLAARGGIGWSPEPAVAFRLHVASQTVRGSAQAKDFAAQLAAPIQGHGLAAARDSDRKLLRMAQASASLNKFLAGRYHGQQSSFGPFLRDFLSLGPLGWVRFLRYTRIIARLSPRIRLFLLDRQRNA